MIKRTCLIRSRRCVNSGRRTFVLTAVAGIGVAGLLMDMNGVSQLNWLSSRVNAQTSKSSGGLPDFADILERVKPAVVGVRTQIEEETTGRRPPPGLPRQQESPFEEFFGAPNERPGVPRPSRPQTNLGSGFFVSADGYLVTTNHLIDHAKSIEITTDDNKTYRAKLVGADSRSDIALLKVDGDQEFPSVRLSDSTPRIGEWIFAVGNPFGLGGTVTAGIISARARDIKMGTYNDFLQIDAPVNQGNSGGPTFDLEGNVIGVNSAIFSPSGGSIGIGFAVPADTVKAVVAQLKDKGRIARGWLGIKIQAVTEDVAQGLGIKPAQGALVVEPQPNSPAAKAGLVAGDVVTSLNGDPIKDDRELMKKVGDLPPGTSVKLAVLRKGEEITITLMLGELPG